MDKTGVHYWVEKDAILHQQIAVRAFLNSLEVCRARARIEARLEVVEFQLRVLRRGGYGRGRRLGR